MGVSENGGIPPQCLTLLMFGTIGARDPGKARDADLDPRNCFKMHSSVMGGGSGLGVVFVKSSLPELENIYAQEMARENMSQGGVSIVGALPPDDSNSEEPVSEEETDSKINQREGVI